MTGVQRGKQEGLNSELVLKPVAVYDDPFREGILVMCSTHDNVGNPLPSNYRDKALEIFNKTEEEPWFGIEQEYFIFKPKEKLDLKNNKRKQGEYYCGLGMGKIFL